MPSRLSPPEQLWPSHPQGNRRRSAQEYCNRVLQMPIQQRRVTAEAKVRHHSATSANDNRPRKRTSAPRLSGSPLRAVQAGRERVSIKRGERCGALRPTVQRKWIYSRSPGCSAASHSFQSVPQAMTILQPPRRRLRNPHLKFRRHPQGFLPCRNNDVFQINESNGARTRGSPCPLYKTDIDRGEEIEELLAIWSRFGRDSDRAGTAHRSPSRAGER